ncbi:Chemotaxis protein [Vibrio aestuarianus]|uniref:chemotaxis protein n=1 Tax=Vibrio aestuarianus TaxID=28171 RepID=UPI001455F32B|nr:chemotaxis protein [Vibrio aestuarianus]NLS63626.1 chemotaxis protein [Vibrio aestuarianus subsp. francensis]CAH8189099.1 Chemotaxis protein [Vibrio aestuarianus]
MKIEGLLLDSSDITQETKTGRGGELLQAGKFKLITTCPTDTMKVNVSPELWKGGESGKLLQQCVGKRMMFEIEFKEFSFANDEGKHVALKGFHLYSLPELSK